MRDRHSIEREVSHTRCFFPASVLATPSECFSVMLLTSAGSTR